jgi:hypothetical protein
VTWGGCHVPSKTPADARSRGGGGASVAGKSAARRSAERGQQENEQDERLDNLEQQAPATPDPPAQDSPAAAPSIPDQLNQLAALYERGTLTDDEFTAAKARLLGG